MSFHIQKKSQISDGLLLKIEGQPTNDAIAFFKKMNAKVDGQKLSVPSQSSFEVLKWANRNGGIYLEEKKIIADFFGNTFFNESSGTIVWNTKSLSLSSLDLIGRGPPHWFINGIILKQLPEDLAWEEIVEALNAAHLNATDPTPIIVITDGAGSFANLLFAYGEDTKYTLGSNQNKFQRRKNFEKNAEKDLLEAGYIKKAVGSTNYYCPREKAFEALELLYSVGWKIESPSGLTIHPYSSYEAVFEAINTHIEVKGNIYFQDKPLPLGAIRETSDSSLLVPFGENKAGLLPEGWKKLFGDWFEETSCDGGRLFLKRNKLGLLDPGKKISVLEIDDRPLGETSVAATLRPYQKEAVEWLSLHYQHGFHALLADDMGLGKTLETLAFLSRVKSSLPSLLVMPASLIFNWKNEIARFLNKEAICHHGDSRLDDFSSLSEGSIVITSYGMLRQNITQFESIQWHTVILDEAQHIKSQESLTKKAVSALNSVFRISLTGTPIENHSRELYAHFHFLMPDLLGDELEFRRDLQAGKAGSIRKKIRPFILRRKKEDVAKDLPPKIEQKVFVEMTEGQKTLFKGLKKDAYALLKGNWKKLEALEAILRLRQAACHPLLVGMENCESAKMEALLIDLETIFEEGKKALVYSQFTSFLMLLEKELKKRGWNYALLTGSTKDREKEVDKFQNDPAIPFFLLSLKAGGVGLNLTKADYVFLFEPWWNQAVENQAIDRAYRIGREDTVFVKRYLLKNSIEEKIEILKEKKMNLSEFFLGTEEEALSSEDLLFLLEDDYES